MSGLFRGRLSRERTTRTRARTLLVLGGALGLGGIFAVVAEGATPPAYAATASITPALYYIGDSTGSNYVFTVKNTGTSVKIGAVEISRPSTYWTVNGCVAPYGWAAQLADTKCRFRASNSSFYINANGASKSFTVKAKTAAGNVDRVGTWPVVVSRSNQFDNTSLLKYATASGAGLTTRLHTFELITAVVSDNARTPGTACPAANKDAVVGATKTIVVCGRNRANVALLPSSAYSSLGGTFIKTPGTFSSGVIQPNSANVVLAQWVGTAVSDTFGSGLKVVTKVGARSDRTSPLRTFTGYNATSAPPVANADSGYSTAEDTTLNVPAPGVLGNDSDPEGDPLTAVDATDPAHGSVTLNPDGSFTYTPDANYAGTDTFQYKAYDTHSKSGAATVTITVTPVNDVPVAGDDAPSVSEDSTGSTLLVLGNDVDVDGDTLAVTAVDTTGTTGSVTNNGTHVTYDPDGKFESLGNGQTATDTFTYTVGDGHGGTDVATVTVTITGANDAPMAGDDAYTTTEDASTGPLTVLANDTDAEGALTITAVSATSNGGTVANNGDGTVTFNPGTAFQDLAAGAHRDTTFTYTVTDLQGATDTATVTITVNGLNDGPQAVNDAQTVGEDSTGATVAVLGNDTDTDGDTLAVTAVDTTGTTGSVTNNGTDVTYSPNGQFEYLGDTQTATDTFTYTVGDGHGGTSTATVTITIDGDNDDPVALDDSYTTDEATATGPLSVLINDSDAEGGLTIKSVSATTNGGTVANNGDGTLTFNPAGAFEDLANGAYRDTTFTYTVEDADHATDTATVTVRVNGINDAPLATDDTKTVGEDSSGTSVNVLANDTDAESQTLTVSAVDTTGTVGTVTNNGTDVTYSPNGMFDSLPAGQTATDTFTYTVTDTQGATDVASVTVTVTGANDAPVANDDSYSTLQDVPLSVSAPGVLGNDTDADTGATKTAGNASTPAHGSVTLNANGSFTYTPASGYTGADSFTYDVTDGTATDTATVSITVASPNATPTADATSASGNEDGGGITVTLTGHDDDGDALTFTALTASNGLVTVPGAVSCDSNVPSTCTATVTYTPNANFNGSDTFTYTVNDGTIDSAPATATITVNPVNDAPSFTKGADQTVNEDAGPRTVTGWATAISVGPANESAQAPTFVVTNGNNALFSAQPAVSPTGELTYTPAPNANGVATVSVSVTDDGGTANGGVDSSPIQTFTITVNAVNDAPSFTKGADQVVNEDGGAQSVSNWATAISKGPADESAQTLTFTSSNDNNALFSAQPAVSPTGTLTYTPAPNAVGSATVTVTLSDNGGTGGSGDDTSDPQTFTITVNPVNDPPSFTIAGSQSVLEDAGAQTVNGFVTSTSAGPADESGQTVTVAVTNVTNSALFSAQPAITNGTLTYTPAPNANGISTVTVNATDDGGVASGGNNTSGNQTFSITITAVNDAPSFTKGSDQTMNEDAGAQSISGWATAISKGPADESGQTLTFTATNDNNALFSAQPAVSPTGTLTLTPAPNKYGSATITVTLSDDGGIANGGDNASDPQTFVITVNPVNDAPVAVAKSFTVQTNMKISLGGLLFGATDPNDVAGDPSWTPTFTVGSITPAGGCVGCTVSNVNAATGSFDFEPPAGGTGTYTMTYTVVDNGFPSPGATSAPQTITLTVSGDVIWFADAVNGTDGAGRGTLTRPFKTLAAVAGVDATAHKVFLFPGTYTDAYTVQASSLVAGSGAEASSFDALYGITPPAGTVARPSINGTNPTVSGAVTLGSNDSLRGLTLTGAPALSGTSFGTLTLGSNSAGTADLVVNSAGQALNLSTGTISGDFGSVTSTGGAGDNVNLTSVSSTGTSLGSGALSGSTGGDGLEINGGAGSFSYSGTISNAAAGRAVAILNKTGTSTVALSGAINDSSGAGVAMTANSAGTTVNLTGGVVLSSGTQPAFAATGGGTVTVTGAANTIASTTGTALNIANTTIGAGDVTFQKIDSNGAATGIVLDNTGSTGNLNVTGTGTTAGSGGTIQNGTGADMASNQCAAVGTPTGTGIFLRNTRDVSLKNMNLSNFSNFAVLGYDVTNLTMDRFSVTGTNGSNASQDEDSVHFCNLLGSATISNSTINGGFEDSLRVYNTSGTLNRLTVSNSTLASRSATTDADDAFLATAFNTATMNVTLDNVTVTTARGDVFQYALGDSSTGDVVIQNSHFSNNHPAPLGGGGGVTLGAGSSNTAVSTSFTYAVTNSTFRDAVGNGLTLFLGNGTSTGTVSGNAFGVTGVAKSAGASGIGYTKIKGGGTAKIAITNNTIRSYGADAGIRMLANDGNPTVRATITGNVVAEPSTASGSPSFAGISVEPGALGTDTVTMCLDMGGAGALQNSVSTGDPSNFNDINLSPNGNTTVDLPGYTGGTADTTAVGNYLKVRNSGDGTPTTFVGTSFSGTSSYTHVQANCL